jgi:hypothetical protein
VTEDEVGLAVTAYRQAWQYTPMPDVQRRQFERLFAGYQTAAVRDVLDDLIRLGVTRPGPAEMGELLRSKAGLRPAGGRARRYGHTVDDDGWREGMVPANEPGWLEGASDARRRLSESTESEKLEAHNAVAQRRAGSAAKPEWWGRD